MRLRIVKTVLWFFVGAAVTVAALRFLVGLGASTALTDVTPWGLWIGFDVLGGVALAAGGFVIAATVHIFHRERFEPILKPAILTAFLGYGAVVVGLLCDLGLPWNIWRPTFYWQHHSALFEVAWCVMLYLTVLALEFSPVVFERLRFNKAFRLMRRFTLPLVILGIMLSTLHQSSLGSLFLIMPFRLNPLWYSPLLPVLFFVSAIGLGLAMVSLESLVTSWIYKREAELDLLGSLARAASVVLALYAAVRIIDLGVRGQLGRAFDGSWMSALFAFELLLSAIAPAVMFSFPRIRRSKPLLTLGALMVVAGFVLNRLNVGGIGMMTATGSRYFPSLWEFAVSAGIVSGAALVFFFFVENCRVYETPPVHRDPLAIPAPDPISQVRLDAPWASDARRYSLAFVAASALILGLAPPSMLHSARPKRTPAKNPMLVEALAVPSPSGVKGKSRYSLFDREQDVAPASAEVRDMLLIDANRNGRFVLFDHEKHKQSNGGQASCGKCHHMNKPLSRATSCHECHGDMYVEHDIFSHQIHVEKMGGNRACTKCHGEGPGPKTAANTTPCLECHRRMRVPDSLVTTKAEAPLRRAPGYMDAMHTLCIDCHRKKDQELHPDQTTPALALCTACHKSTEEETLEEWMPHAPERKPSGEPRTLSVETSTKAKTLAKAGLAAVGEAGQRP